MKHFQQSLLPSLALAICFFALSVSSCVHDQVQGEFESVTLIDSPQEGRVLTDYQSLRVLFDFSQLVVSDSALYDYIVNVLIPPAKNYLGATLKIPATSAKLGIDSTSICGGAITVPAVYKTTGVDADLVIFVTADNQPSASYVAYSLICLIESSTNRPVGGLLHYNTAMIQQKNKEAQREADLVTTIHEITHILGFSASIYDRYRNPSTGALLTGHYYNKSTTVNGMTIPVLNLATLTSKLRTYFGCNTLEGAYLENEGTSGSLGSHFERRIFYNEFMTASRLNDARISEFTLALLEGSGWYQVNYNMAEPMTWGKGKGCSFVDGACVNTGTRVANYDEFCSPLMERGCSWTGREGSMCGGFGIYSQASVSSAVNWWSNSTVVLDTYADNCPIYQPFSNTDCEDVENIASPKVTGSASGYGSKCFMGTLSNTADVRPFGSYCFKATCDGSSTIKVTVGDYTATCSAEGTINVPGMSGTLSCPDPTKYCNVFNNEGTCRRKCLGKGSCSGRDCTCEAGWGSMDCGLRVYTDCTRCTDSSKPSCYGDTCACSPTDTRCNGSGLTVVAIVAIAVGAAIFVITLILIIKYRKSIMAKLTRKKKPTSLNSPPTLTSPNPQRIHVDRTSSNGLTAAQPEQKGSPLHREHSIPSPTTMRNVRLDFESNAGYSHSSPMREFMADRASVSGMMVREQSTSRIRKE